jgi:hypothetical protein
VLEVSSIKVELVAAEIVLYRSGAISVEVGRMRGGVGRRRVLWHRTRDKDSARVRQLGLELQTLKLAPYKFCREIVGNAAGKLAILSA